MMAPPGARTSRTHPLRVDVVAAGPGRIGMTFCPGKVQAHALTGSWARDLDLDLAAIVALGATTLVSLIERHELDALAVADLPARAERVGLVWHGLELPDGDVPRGSLVGPWQALVTALVARLRAGELVVVHCKGGLGRTGTLAAHLLVALGHTPADAITRVRAARPGTIETAAQVAFVESLGSRA